MISLSSPPKNINMYLTCILKLSIKGECKDVKNVLWLLTLVAAYDRNIELTPENINLIIIFLKKTKAEDACESMYTILNFLYSKHAYIDFEFF